MTRSLAIQNHIIEHGLESLKNPPFCIDYKIYNDLVILNYNQIESSMGEKIAQEARGLILELDSWKIVNKSFDKFFNHGEGFIPALDWPSVSIEEKVDGSIIGFWNHRGVWRVSTKKVIDADQQIEKVPSMVFRDVIDLAIAEMGYTFESFTSHLDPACSYSFELTAPETQVQIFYPDRKLTLLGKWSRETGREIRDFSYSFPRPKLYPIHQMDMAGIVELANSFNCNESEGFVLLDKNNNRIKVKNAKYVLASRFKDSCYHPRHMIELIQLDQFDDVISVVPEFWANKIKAVHARVQNFLIEVDEKFKTIKHIEVQKDFAMEALKYRYKSFLFTMRRFNKTAYEVFKETHPDSLTALMELK